MNEKEEEIIKEQDINDKGGDRLAKFQRTVWKLIERILPTQILLVLTMLKSYGSENTDNNPSYTQTNLQYCGDEIYSTIRYKAPANYQKTLKKEPEKVSVKSDKKPKKIKEKMLKKKDQIILQNSTVKVKEQKDKLLNFINDTNLSERDRAHVADQIATKTKYAEIKLIALMSYIDKMCPRTQKKIKGKTEVRFKKLGPDDDFATCFELCIGVKKILTYLKDDDKVSKLALEDLNDWLQILITACDFSIEKTISKYPRFALETQYDKIFPAMMNKPYDSQVQLFNAIKNNEKTLVLYNTPPGTGKTTSVVLLYGLIEKANQYNLAHGIQSKSVIVFCCSLQTVRIDVCRQLYSTGCKFAIAVFEDGKVRIINSYSCIGDPYVIVADPRVTLELLMKSNLDITLFVDELTAESDTPNVSEMSLAMAKILLNCPKKTILSSATLPKREEMPDIIAGYKKRYPDSHVEEIHSKDSRIGCHLVNMNKASLYVPIQGCTTKSELKYVIEQIDTVPFIGRLMPGPVVYQIRETMIKFGIEDVLNLEQHFKDVSTLNQREIQKAGIILLKQLVEHGDDDMINKICNEIPFTSDRLLESYDINKIFEEQAYCYAGPCLVIVENPLEFAMKTTANLINTTNNVKTASEYIKDYDEQVKKYNDTIEKVKKANFQAANKKTNKNNQEGRNKGDFRFDTEKRDHRLEEVQAVTPSFNFPRQLQVNTKEHAARYGNVKKLGINIQCLFEPSQIPTDLPAPDLACMLLYMGIGIYAPNESWCTPQYAELVMEMASDGKLAYVISNESICYGTNMPFSHGIVSKEFAKNHSINTLIQLFGRIGRGIDRDNRSWVAWVFVDDDVIKRIHEYVHDVDQPISIEALNLTRAYHKVKASMSGSGYDDNELELEEPADTSVADVRHNGNNIRIATKSLANIKNDIK